MVPPPWLVMLPPAKRLMPKPEPPAMVPAFSTVRGWPLPDDPIIAGDRAAGLVGDAAAGIEANTVVETRILLAFTPLWVPEA